MSIFLMWVGVAGLPAAPANAREVMTWALQNFPPIYLPENGKPGSGISDVTVKMLVERMPDLEHQYIEANVARIYYQLDAGKELCFVGGLYTPERAERYWLADMQLIPPLQLIVSRRAIAQLPMTDTGAVKLPQLLAESKLRGLMVATRSYGPRIDSILKNRPADSGMQPLSGSSVGANYFDMLAARRMDYTIDYDFVLAYRQRLDPKRYGDLQVLPIDGNEELVKVVTVCPRTAWGLRAINRINRLFAELAANPDWVRNVQRWRTDEARTRYDAAINRFNQQRQRLPVADIGP